MPCGRIWSAGPWKKTENCQDASADALVGHCGQAKIDRVRFIEAEDRTDESPVRCRILTHPRQPAAASSPLTCVRSVPSWRHSIKVCEIGLAGHVEAETDVERAGANI